MAFTMVHNNINVADLDVSLKFYSEAFGLYIAEQKKAADGSYIITYLTDGSSPWRLELTWLADHPQKYDLGENEIHLAFRADDFDAAFEKHKAMGVVCYENPAMGIYFVEDPDGYWMEVLPARR